MRRPYAYAFYKHGTRETAVVYADADLQIPHTWPVVLDADGMAPTIFLAGKDPANEYDLVIEDEKRRPLASFCPLHSPCVPRWLGMFGMGSWRGR